MILSESRQTFFVGRSSRIAIRKKANGAGNSRAVATLIGAADQPRRISGGC
jgi:hypothetical protein